MTSTDGRVARREHNRTAALDAVIELFERGVEEPSIDEVSVLSGVSTRSVYRYFHHRDQLITEAMLRLMARIKPEMALELVGQGPLEERIDRFTRHRLRIFLALAPLRQAARRAAHNENMVELAFEEARVMLRRQFLEHFAKEFGRLEGRERTRAIIGAELPFQFESFEYLHEACRRDLAEVVLVVNAMLAMQFAAISS